MCGPGDLAWDRDAVVTKQGPRQGGSGLGHAYTSRSEKLQAILIDITQAETRNQSADRDVLAVDQSTPSGRGSGS